MYIYKVVVRDTVEQSNIDNDWSKQFKYLYNETFNWLNINQSHLSTFGLFTFLLDWHFSNFYLIQQLMAHKPIFSKCYKYRHDSILFFSIYLNMKEKPQSLI